MLVGVLTEIVVKSLLAMVLIDLMIILNLKTILIEMVRLQAKQTQ